MAQLPSIDSGFRKAKAASAERRRRRRIRRWLGWISAVAVVAIVAGVALNYPLLAGLFSPAEAPPPPADEVADAPDVYIPAIVDLAGDPLRISIGETATTQLTRFVPRPEGVPAERATGQIALLSDVMITRSQRFMTTLPSSPKDFAFYQSQRLRSAETINASATAFTDDTGDLGDADTEPDLVAVDDEPDLVPVDPDGTTETPDPAATVTTDPATVDDDSGDGWGDNLNGTSTDQTVQPTAVANTTSVAEVTSEQDRFKPDQDYFMRVLVERTLEDMVAENGLPAADGSVFASAMKTLLSRDNLEPGDVVAMRAVRETAFSAQHITQLAIYHGETYIGALTRTDDGNVVVGADPWVYEDLFHYSGQEEVAQPGRQYRLLDAIYSTAVRNQVPTGVLGEAIVLLSRKFDLDAFASTDDRLVLAYAKDGEGDAGGIGRVLYAAIKGKGRDLECFVYKAPTDQDYSCFSEQQAGPGATTPNGMITPVNGVLTSTFGPRMHPIFHEVRVHTGVDWAAPIGTPVYAAYPGTVISAAVAGGYGNMIRLGHPGGRETRYAHLSKFADGLVAGKAVAAGELIGYVGTTGNSTGPHLHFELRVADAPVDPLTTVVVVTASVAAAPVETAAVGSDDEAVSKLVEKIVRVESGGKANAKNPLSSATGAGQFIKSTWLRMMRTYRPDLANSMGEADLLALRNDATLAREMVRNLAREGEAYLKARGHGITAGRLYLCHFLGMEDAHRILATTRETALEAVLSTGVMNANPFLKGHDVGYVQDWAERKMSGKAPPPPTTTTTTTTTTIVAQSPAASPEFALYKKAIAEVLEQPENDAIPGLPVDPNQPTTPVNPPVPDSPADGDTAMLSVEVRLPEGQFTS